MKQHAESRLSVLLLAAILVVAFAAGGGGSKFALANLAVQLTAVAALAFHRASFVQFWRDSPVALRILIAASLLLPLLQLVPLPPAIWSSLPGRDLAVRSLELVGIVDEWRPGSLDPLRTLLALSALVTPIAVVVVGWTVPRERLITLGWLVVILGLVTALLGVAQLGPSGAGATLFGTLEPGSRLLGTFANRNSTGLFLVFALALAAVLPTPKPHAALVLARLAVCALLMVAIILTRSRSALALAILPLMLGSARALWWGYHERRRTSDGFSVGPFTIAIGAIALVAAGTTTLVIAAPGRVAETFERFQAKDDPRRFIWDDAAYSVERYWPAGAGMGTFDEVFQVDESLENLTMRRAGRAHNEYIELAIEAGPFGLLLAALWLALLAWLTWSARRSSQRWTAWAASAFLLAIALQSVTDYPLRNQTILAFAGFALLLLTRIANDSRMARR